MANPVIKVILSAVDEITGVTKKAGESVASFSEKAKGALGSLAALGVGAALGAFFKSAIEEASAAEVGMGRLGTAVRNAGGNFEQLKPQLEDTVASVMRLSTATDDDLRAALTNMITISGDVEGSQKNLALAADLAAFKHISLEEAATTVGKAMNGNVTAFNKLGVAGETATAVLENARASFGGFAEKEAATFSGTVQRINNQWGEFKEAVGTAILSSGQLGGAADGLAGVLAGLAGWVEENEGGFRLVTSAIGDAVGAVLEIGKTLWEVAGPALQFVGKYVGGALVAALNTAVWGVRGFGASFKGMAGTAIDALGLLVEKGGKLLKLFGVTVVTEAGTSMRQFGQQLADSAAADMTRANEIYVQSWSTLLQGSKDTNKKIEEDHRQSSGKREKILTDAEKKLLEAQKNAQAERIRINEEYNRLILVAADKLQQGLAKTGGSWEDIKKKVDLAYGSVLQITAGTGNLAAAAAHAADENKRIKDEAAKAKKTFDDNVDSAVSLGVSFASAANGMGMISDQAATALTSLINMGAAISKFGIGSPEGIISIVGALAQLIGGWGSHPAYKAQQDASMKNTRAIEELTRDLSDYNGAASGRTFAGVLESLQEESTLRGGAAFLSPKAIEENLRKRGLTLADAKRIAEKYGIDVENDQEGWSKLLGILNSRKFGSGQGNFADELSSITDSFGVLGTEDADDKLKAFRAFTARNIPILFDALQGDLTTEGDRTAAMQRLRALYTKSINAQISPADYKNATPQQFRQLIATLLPLLGDANGILGSGDVLGTGTSSDPIGGVPATGGTVGMVGSTGGVSSSLSPGLQLPGGDLPSPTGIPDAYAGAGASIGTVINGGVVQNFYVNQRDGETDEDFMRRVAEAVDLRALTRYDAVVAANGTLPLRTS